MISGGMRVPARGMQPTGRLGGWIRVKRTPWSRLPGTGTSSLLLLRTNASFAYDMPMTAKEGNKARKARAMAMRDTTVPADETHVNAAYEHALGVAEEMSKAYVKRMRDTKASIVALSKDLEQNKATMSKDERLDYTDKINRLKTSLSKMKITLMKLDPAVDRAYWFYEREFDIKTTAQLDSITWRGTHGPYMLRSISKDHGIIPTFLPDATEPTIHLVQQVPQIDGIAPPQRHAPDLALAMKGNVILPFQTIEKPSIRFETQDELYYSVMMLNLDYPVEDQARLGIMCHWLHTNIKGDRANPTVTTEDLSHRGHTALPYLPPHPWRGVGCQRFLTVLMKHRHPIVHAFPSSQDGADRVAALPDAEHARGVGLAMQYFGTEAGSPDAYRHRLLLKSLPDVLQLYAQAKVVGHTHFQSKWTRHVTHTLCAPGNPYGLSEKVYAMPMRAESADPFHDRHRFEFA